MMDKKKINLKISFTARLRRYFVTGLLVIFPLALTVLIFWKLFFWMEGLVDIFFRKLAFVYIPGLGVLFVLVSITFVGMVAANFFGRKIFSFAEKVFKRIPLFNKVYKAIQEISYASLGRGKGLFREVVLVEYPREGLFTLAFVTNRTQEEIERKLERSCLNVFIPTSPNPTSGMLIIVPKEKVIPLSMTIEEGFKLIVSGGAFNPSSIVER